MAGRPQVGRGGGLLRRTASEDCERGLLVDGVAGRVGALLLKPPVNSDQTSKER